mgnify:CR=1 FL=1
MPLGIDHLQQKIGEWSDVAFGVSTPEASRTYSILEHMKEEVEELQESPTDLTEYADVFTLLLDAARTQGISGEDILFAAYGKLAENRHRQWGPVNEKGYHNHIKADDLSK